jgi:ribosomal protein S18 acetylase RimI-like enzyme
VNTIHLRKLKIEDTDHVRRIFSALNKSEVSIDYPQLIQEKIRREEDISVVAEIDGKAVGFMFCEIISGGFGLLEESGWIVMFGIDPNFMGQGIGKRLAEEIFSLCIKKGIRKIYSSVRWDSVDLLSFFKTLGFDRSDFINLEKELKL